MFIAAKRFSLADRWNFSAVSVLFAAFICTLLLLTPASAWAAIDVVSMSVSRDGTAGWDPSSGAGLDTGGNNSIVRTNDSVEYLITYRSTGNDNNVTFTFKLPTGNLAPRLGQSIAQWEFVPSQCTGPGSVISADKQTLTCNVGNITTSQTQSFYVSAIINGTTPNGTALPAPTLTVSPSLPTTVITRPTTDIAITAAPFYDVVIDLSYNGNPRAFGYGEGSGPAGEDGYYHRALVGLAARNPNGNGRKGVEQLDPSRAINFTINLDGYPTGVRIANWHTSGANAATGSFGDGCGSPSNGRPSVLMGGVYNNHDRVTDGGPTVTSNYSAVINGGDCAVTSSSGSAVSLAVTGTDTTLATRPYALQTTMTPIPLSNWWVMQKGLVLWTPTTSYPANTVVPHTLTLGSVSGVSISGQQISNVRTTNDSITHNINVVAAGSGSKYFTADTSLPAPYATECDPTRVGDCITNYFSPGQTVMGRVLYSNSGVVPTTNVALCEIIDRTVFDIGTNFGVTIDAGSSIEYGTRAAGRYFSSTETAVDEHAGGNLSSSTYGNASCDDAGITWHSSWQAAEGAGGLVYVRSVVPKVAPTSTGRMVVRGMIVRPTYAATIDVIGGTQRVQGQRIADGTIVRNIGRITGPSLATSITAIYRDHARVATMRTRTRIAKDLIAPTTSTSTPLPSGTTVKYRLTPRFSTTFPPQPRNVTVTDILPPGLEYIAGSATQGGAPVEPQVINNSPGSGYTTLRWVYSNAVPYLGANNASANMPPVEFSARISATASDGGSLNNSATASAGVDDYDPDCVYSTATVSYGTCDKSASVTIRVQTPPGFRLEKTASPLNIEPGDDFSYRISYGSLGQALLAVDTPDLIDILPYVGDNVSNSANNYTGRTTASVLTGNAYSLQSVTLPTNDAGMQVYYTNRAPTQINNDPQDSSNNLATGTTRWCLASQLGSAGCPANIAASTAVRLSPTPGALTANMLFDLTLMMKSDGGIAKRGDIFSNSVGARSPNVGSALVFLDVENISPVRVVASGLSGRIFADAQQNNIFETATDKGIADQCVLLTGTAGGATVTYSTRTLADGTYSFAPPLANRVFASSDCTGTALASFQGFKSGTYSVAQIVQPPEYEDGADYAGSGGGTVENNRISAIAVAKGATLLNYNFTEIVALIPLTLAKTGTVIRDPIRGTNSPGPIPGAVIKYSFEVKNPHVLAVGGDSITITDPLPPSVGLYTGDLGAAGTGPINFTANSSTLTLRFGGFADLTDDVAFSSDGGVTWNYVPVAGPNGADIKVTHIRFKPKGSMAPGSTVGIDFGTVVK